MMLRQLQVVLSLLVPPVRLFPLSLLQVDSKYEESTGVITEIKRPRLQLYGYGL